ncbi:phage replisome organizer N-terminal domain-containing protein [Ruminiclostridium josui]|uniref:phage replisome organizer N-terminal domain-containing protein n=1 Tax=Ruminiclostridium josui TaxID=1499 RepID=UPI0004657152|nr:phage replisome organizer N-terminal domain-containing protein [Ruminiclostridium josui]
MAKRYYWLRLKEDFYDQKEIKKLRKIAGGDTYVIIYQRIQLLSLKTDGLIYFDGIEDDLAGELALELDESEDNVRITLQYMSRFGLIREVGPNKYEITTVAGLIGSESESAERVRRFRERKAAELQGEALQKALLGNGEALHGNESVTTCNTEKIRDREEIEKEIETEDTQQAGAEQSLSQKRDSVPFEKIRQLFNEICVSYSSVINIEGQRRKAVAARWKTYKDLETFRTLFQKTEASNFLKGQNDRNWSADFDWIMRPTNFTKVLEGRYDSDKPKGGTQYGTGADQQHTEQNSRQSFNFDGWHIAEDDEE